MEADSRPTKIRKLSHGNDRASNEPSSEHKTPQQPVAESNLKPLLTTTSGNESQGSDSEPEQYDPTDLRLPDQTAPSPSQSLSKNQLKKLRKKQEWEAGKDYRKAKRKEKIKEKRERKREERQQNGATHHHLTSSTTAQRHVKPTRLPITFIIDCGFDDRMSEKERVSLGSQLTRAYSDNSKAKYQAHLVLSSWGGHLKDRFDTVIHGQYRNWKDTEFTEDDFVTAAAKATETMKAPRGGKLDGVFQKYNTSKPLKPPSTGGDAPSNTPAELPEPEIVYLTSDSPNILTTLKPYSTYVIGGIVDKNRYKGLCYNLAESKGIKTAKLPISEYMEMQSRSVLATNHVLEIMVRWLELGDWGEAFLRVIPKRKGGRLKGSNKDGGGVVGEEGKGEVEEEGEDEEKGQEQDEVLEQDFVAQIAAADEDGNDEANP